MKKVILFSCVLFLMTATSSMAFAKSDPELDPDIVNPLPTVPVILDGERVNTEAIRKFDNQTLYYLVDDQAKTDGVIYVFTTLEKIENFATERQQQRKHHVTSCGTTSDLFINSYFGDSVTSIFPNSQRRFTGLLYSLYDNNVSSVKTTAANMHTKLYDNTNYTGSQLWLASCGDTPTLNIYGWDNRAGSVRVE